MPAAARMPRWISPGRLVISIAASCVFVTAMAAGDAQSALRTELLKGLANGMPSISISIATRQGVVWSGAVGYADLRTRCRAGEAP